MTRNFLSNKYCNIIMALLGMFWLSALAGFAYLTSYDLVAGSRGRLQMSWPLESNLELAREGCTAIVFLHPRCPCSLATANELAKVMTRAQGKLTVYAVVRPTSLSDSAIESLSIDPTDAKSLSSADSNSLLIKNIDAIPGIKRVTDVGSREGKLFGAETSGDVLVYSKSGQLTFAGGITASRGHEGDNNGADAMLSAVQDVRRVTISTTPVFGCSLIEK